MNVPQIGQAGGAHVQDITSMKKHLERGTEGEQEERRPGAAFCRSTAGSTEKNEWVAMPFMPLLKVTYAFVKIRAKELC